MSSDMGERKRVPVVDDYRDPVITEGPETVYVFTVGDEMFLSREEAEKRKNVLKNKVRMLVGLLGIEDHESQAVLVEPVKWLLEHYPLSDFKRLHGSDFFSTRSPFLCGIYSSNPDINSNLWKRHPADNKPYVWSWMEGRPFNPSSDAPKDLGETDAIEWKNRHSQLFGKLGGLSVVVQYRATELLYATAVESAEFDEEGNVVSVLPLDLVASMVDFDPLVSEVRDIYSEFNRVEHGKSLEFGTVEGAPRYWWAEDKKTLDPFKRF